MILCPIDPGPVGSGICAEAEEGIDPSVGTCRELPTILNAIILQRSQSIEVADA